ncbi:MAG: SBBP repeat-containing protein [Terriglobales bacterium]
MYRNNGVHSLDFQTIAIDPVNPANVYAGGDGGFYKSIDHGATWSSLDSGMPGNGTASGVQKIVIDPLKPSTLYLSRWEIRKSTDGGATWVDVWTPPDVSIRSFAIDPVHTATLYAATSGGVYKSSDGGVTWTAANTGLTNPDIYSVAVDFQNPNNVYAVTNRPHLMVFKSINGGGSWSQASPDWGLHWNLSFIMDPTNPQTLYIGGTCNELIKTTNGGQNWTFLSIPTCAFAMAVDPQNPQTIYIGSTSGSYFKSVNGGASWTTVSMLDPNSRPIAANQVKVIAVDPSNSSNVYFGTHATDAFVAKIASDYSGLVFSTYLGGDHDWSNNSGNAIAVDSSGYAYVAGETDDDDFPLLGGLGFSHRTVDGFVTKFSPAGMMLYSTRLGGSDWDVANSIAVDDTGAAYIAGTTVSKDFPVVSPVHSVELGPSDAFVTKVDPSGSSILYSTYLGGSGDEGSYQIILDQNSTPPKAYVAGYTTSSDFPMVEPIQSSLAGTTNAFIVGLDGSGNVMDFSTYLGGSSDEYWKAGIALDAQGNLYAAGNTNSADFPLLNPIQSELNGPGDAFIAKIATVTTDLSVSSSASLTVMKNEPYDVLVTVTNNGPNDTSGVVLTVSPSAGLAMNGAPSPSQGSCEQSATAVTCGFGTLGQGATAAVSVSVTPTVANTQVQTIASVTANLPDPDLTNNASTAITGVLPIVVLVSPPFVIMQPLATEQFTASVMYSSNTAVIWAVNDVVGGNSRVGTIDTTGFYTAPAIPITVAVQAISAVDSTAVGYGVAYVTLPAADVLISNAPTKGGIWAGGSPDVFTPTATVATVSVSDIVARLNAGNSVNILTNAAPGAGGDVIVSSPIAWNGNAVLFVTARRNIVITSDITATANSAGLFLMPASGDSSGVYKLTNGAKITLPGATPTFAVSDTTYTVINSASALQALNSAGAGPYALGSDIDASATATWNANGSNGFYGFAPIGNPEMPFNGTLDGLGHIVSNLYIAQPAFDYIGLFGFIGSQGVVQNVALTGENIVGRYVVGGLAGKNYGTIANSFTTGTVVGATDGNTNQAGGFVGYNLGTINGSYSTAAVTGGWDTGGFVGRNDGSIADSYSTGNVNGYNPGWSIGGFAGGYIGDITNSYSTGMVSGGGETVGGFAGWTGGGTVTNSIWDMDVSGWSSSYGGTGLATYQMMDPASFSGWDFLNTWGISAGTTYPYLRAMTRTSCAPLPSGLVSWWTGNSTAMDVQGLNHGSTMNGAGYAAGIVAQAFNFNGAQQYIQLPDSVIVSNPVWTVEAWFKTDSGGVIVGMQNGSYGSSPVSNWAPLMYVGTDGTLYEGLWGASLASSQAVNDGQWHHAAVSVNGPMLTAYLDGLFIGGSEAANVQPMPNTQIGTGYTVFWGAANDGWYDFNGQIDEVALFNRVLTADEVQGTYNAGLAGMCQAAPPVAVTVSPLSPTVNAGGSVQFTATVTNAADKSVTWSLIGQGCTGATCGTITAGGLYTAPAVPPSPAEITVTATSNADRTKTASATMVVAPIADLAISESDTDEALLVGGTYAYRYTVTNNGPSAASSIRLAAAIPSTAVLLSATPVTTGWECDASGACTLSSLGANSSATVEFVCRITAFGTAEFSASVSASEFDPTAANNTTTETNAILSVADVSVGLGTAVAGTGNTHTHVVTVTNSGPYVARNVVLTDLMSGDVFVSATVDQGACTGSAQQVRCSIGTVQVGQTVTARIMVTAPSAGWTSHALNASTTDNDPLPTNNSANISNDVDWNTQAGNNVAVAIADAESNSAATATFASVSQPGTTALTTSGFQGQPPAGYRVGAMPLIFDIRSTATYAGSISVVLRFSPAAFHKPARVRIFHNEGGTWVDRTAALDVTSGVVSAISPSLSSFAIFEPVNAAPVANVGIDLTVPGSTASGSSVELDGSGSSDADGDVLTDRWTGPFQEAGGTVGGVRPRVTLPLGTSRVTLVVNDGEVDSPPAVLNVTVSDFLVASSNPAASVQNGGSASYSIAISPKFGGFNAPVALRCSNIPAGMACTFSPPTVTPASNGATSTLTITTSRLTTAGAVGGRSGTWMWLAMILAPFGLAFAGPLGGRKRWYLATALLLLSVIALTHCGGNNTGVTASPNTSHPSVTSAITVTATSGGLAHSTNVNLTVE